MDFPVQQEVVDDFPCQQLADGDYEEEQVGPDLESKLPQKLKDWLSSGGYYSMYYSNGDEERILLSVNSNYGALDYRRQTKGNFTIFTIAIDEIKSINVGSQCDFPNGYPGNKTNCLQIICGDSNRDAVIDCSKDDKTATEWAEKIKEWQSYM